MARKAASFFTGASLLALAAMPLTAGVAHAAPNYSLPTLTSPVAGTTWSGTLAVGDPGSIDTTSQDLAEALGLTSLTPASAKLPSTSAALTQAIGSTVVGTACADSPVQATVSAFVGGDEGKLMQTPLCLVESGWQVNQQVVELGGWDADIFNAATQTITAGTAATPTPTPTVAPTTPAPTPTPTPTEKPTETPAPTSTVTPTPTDTPTKPSPTLSRETPAGDPTGRPTSDPTTAPTRNPTGSPTTPGGNTDTNGTGKPTEVPVPTETATASPSSPAVNTVGAKPTPVIAAAQQQGYGISGRFYKDVDSSSNFDTKVDAVLSGKEISLYKNNVLVGKVKTDANGSYKFSGLQQGDYELRWASDGAVTSTEVAGHDPGTPTAAITSCPIEVDAFETGKDFGFSFAKANTTPTPPPTTKTQPKALVFGNPTSSRVINSGSLEGRTDGGMLAWAAAFLGLGGLALRRGLKPSRVKA